MDLGNLPDGIYLLNIEVAGIVKTQKVFINR
jgi:hypothetical protein